MIQLIDDQLLGGVLRGDRPPRPRQRVFTTGYWYVRLCQALASSRGVDGVLSAPFRALPPSLRARAFHAALELPEAIGLVSLRDLGPLVGRMRERYELNILSSEVVAAAVHLDATVCLSASSPRLEAALHDEGRPVHLTAP